MPREPVVILGGGSTGEAFAAALRRLDDKVEIVLVERELVGGECTYWACMPSKTLIRPAELAAAVDRAPGAAEGFTGELDADRIFWWRDQVNDGLDDEAQEKWLADRNVRLVRGHGRVVGPGRLDVDGTELSFGTLVVATGTEAGVPPIPGLDELPYWTSREATTSHEVPESLVVLGGGVVGCEIAQVYRRLGSAVTIVHDVEHLLPREHPDAGRLIQELFEEEQIAVRLSTLTEQIEHEGGRFRLHLSDGEVVEGERLLVSTGRTPNVEGLGLEQLGVDFASTGIIVDNRLRAAEGVLAIGDVTGIALFTHVGKYQARIAASNVAGGDARADYRAIPAVAFTDPQIASVGRTEGDDLVTSSWRIDATARASTYERPKRPGFLRLFADPHRRVLVGAVAVGPEAGEWIGQVTLAIKAEVDVDVLRDTVQPYPTFSEAVFFAVRNLPLHPAAREAQAVGAGVAG